MADIKRTMTLAAPIPLDAGLHSLVAFDIDYIYVRKDHLVVHLNPPSAGSVKVYPFGALDEFGNPRVTAKGILVLNPTGTTRTSNFLISAEDACKANLELP